jgi:hypothetical protein
MNTLDDVKPAINISRRRPACRRIAQNPRCTNESEITGRSFRLRRMNDTAHLDADSQSPRHSTNSEIILSSLWLPLLRRRANAHE